MLKKVLIFKKSIILLLSKLRILNISSIFVSTKGVKDMAQERKYKVGCSGTGWGVWEIATGKHIASFGRNRYAALEKWYELEGWKKPAYWY